MSWTALLQTLLRDAVSRQLAPSPPEAGRPLSSLVPANQLHRTPAPQLISSLSQQRWAVLDGALPADIIAGAGVEAQRLMATEGAMTRDAALGDLRTDRALSLQPSPSWPHLSALLRRLKAAAARLSAAGALAAPVGSLVSDPDGGMLACYAHGGRYTRHSDVAAQATDGRATRHLTMIVYLRPPAATGVGGGSRDDGGEWRASERGMLRLWPKRGSTSLEWELTRVASAIDVEPYAGRFVVFDASLPHEVLPVAAAARCALTLWVHRNWSLHGIEDES